jgi:glutamyl-tRNA reductase
MEWLYIIPPVAIVALVIIVLWKGWKKTFETILFIAKPATDIAERLVPDNGSILDRLTKWAKIAVVNLELQYKTAKEATEKGTAERDELNKKIEDQAIALMEEWAEVDQREVPDHVENAARAVVRYEVETFLKKLQQEQSAVLFVADTDLRESTEELKETPTLQVSPDPLESIQPTE